MRRPVLLLAVVTVIAAVLATAARATAISPCKLVTAADAKVALGGAAGRPQVQTLGLFRSCTYRRGGVTLTVQTRSVTKAVFVKSAKANPGPVVAVQGLGATAYSAAGFVLLVWRNGTEATFLIFGGGKGFADEKALAKRVVSRL